MPDTTTTAVDLTELGVARGGSRRLTGHLTRPVGAGPGPVSSWSMRRWASMM